MSKYIPADKLKAEIERQQRKLILLSNTEQVDMRRDCALQNGVYDNILGIINSIQQEQPKLYKDESLGSPDYERGFKHGRDYQAYVERKYIKNRVIEYLVNKGYPVSTNVEIPTYQETFDMIKNATEYANQQEQPEVDLEKEIADWIGDEETCKNGKWTFYECDRMIRHFYELGLNARKK